MTHHDNINIAVKLRVAADCFGCSRFLPSETEYGIEFATEALDALPVDLGVQTDGVRQILADPANYDLYQLARWCDGLANRLTERSKVQPRRERKPSKPRRPSISKMIEQAEQAGKPLASITLPDGTKLDFGKPESAASENPWFDDLKVTKQ